MRNNIIITGMPKCGKSTLLRKVIENVDNKVGFVTSEVKEDGVRRGFEMITNAGECEVLADINFKNCPVVSKYSVKIENLEKLIPLVGKFEEESLLYIDEIGQMQLYSEKFIRLVKNFLNSNNTCLATLTAVYENFVTKAIRERDDIIVVNLTKENWNNRLNFVNKLISKIEKAKKYIMEPERFSVNGNVITMSSTHNVRKINIASKSCTCDFWGENSICSHLISAQELFKNKFK